MILIMKCGEIVILNRDTDFFEAGRKAHFIRHSKENPNNAEIVWFGSEESFKLFGDVDIVPFEMLTPLASLC